MDERRKQLEETTKAMRAELAARRAETDDRAPLPGDTTVSASWLTRTLLASGDISPPTSVEAVTLEDLQGNRGLNGAMSRARVTYTNGEGPSSFILKMMVDSENMHYNVIATGGWREGALLSDKLVESCARMPKIFHAEGSTSCGYVVLMEDVGGSGCTGVNFFFGNQIWGMEPLADDKALKPAVVLKEMFLRAATQHAKHWNDKSLLDKKWLKAAPWYSGEGQAAWELGLEVAQKSWRETLGSYVTTNADFKLSPKLESIMNKSLDLSTWANVQSTLKNPKRPFTLVHGDFHASNMLWRHADAEPLHMVDWSEIGVWEPTKDLGQTIISDVRPEVWRGIDKDLVRAYWERLVELGVSADEYPFETCYESYEIETVVYWLWMLCIVIPLVPASCAQYFHDQVLAFIEAHGDHEAYPLTLLATLASWPLR